MVRRGRGGFSLVLGLGCSQRVITRIHHIARWRDGSSRRAHPRQRLQPLDPTEGLEPLARVSHPSTLLRTGSGWSLRASAFRAAAARDSIPFPKGITPMPSYLVLIQFTD